MTKPVQIRCKAMILVPWLRQHVVVFKSLKQLLREVPDVALTPCGGAAGYAEHKARTGQLLFWVMLPERVDLITIVHEAVHVVDYLLEAVGIPVTVANAEVRTYMTGWLVGELCAVCNITPLPAPHS